MKLDTQMTYASFDAIAQEARRFERMGFDGVWTFEAAHDPFLPLALAAAATEKLDIGTNISVAFGRSPFAMAQVGVFIETEFDLYIPDPDLTVDNMDTVAQITDRIILGLSEE